MILNFFVENLNQKEPIQQVSLKALLSSFFHFRYYFKKHTQKIMNCDKMGGPLQVNGWQTIDVLAFSISEMTRFWRPQPVSEACAFHWDMQIYTSILNSKLESFYFCESIDLSKKALQFAVNIQLQTGNFWVLWIYRFIEKSLQI